MSLLSACGSFSSRGLPVAKETPKSRVTTLDHYWSTDQRMSRDRDLYLGHIMEAIQETASGGGPKAVGYAPYGHRGNGYLLEIIHEPR